MIIPAFLNLCRIDFNVFLFSISNNKAISFALKTVFPDSNILSIYFIYASMVFKYKYYIVIIFIFAIEN